MRQIKERYHVMAIYHLEAKIISRGIGRSAVAASAYMSCSRLYNDYDGIEHDYTRKHGLVHQEVILPPNAPAEWADREKLWNAVEESEKTKDSRLAREFVAALPIELTKEEWISLLRQYISDNFTVEGMCADFSIHDTDGHNPHAHILLTVRPLDGNGKWQHKTEKEYLCVCNGEEKGFTSTEYKAAQADGWEKQYQYKIGKKKIYMAPSLAEPQGYERVSKHPKSTRYGRQNPILERWNSDEKLVKWRESWAEYTNKFLENKGITERIDHRSFKTRGITEQPTIHEGVAAQINIGKTHTEKHEIVLERCELNRQIRADNRLLRRLKAELQKIVTITRTPIPKTAKTMELIFSNLIIYRYNQKQAENVVWQCDEWLNDVKPDYQKYIHLKKEAKSKKCLLHDLKSEQKHTSKLNITKQMSLSKEITALTEDIEELKSELSNLFLSYRDEASFLKLCSKIPNFEERRKKQADLQATLKSRIAEQTQNFLALKTNIPPEQETELKSERSLIHPDAIEHAREHLQSAYQSKFVYQQFKEAQSYISESLNEAEKDLSIRQRLEQAKQDSKYHNTVHIVSRDITR